MKASITGINGFIGGALNKRLLSMGWQTYSMLRPDVNYVFLFGSASSDHWFKNAFSYNMRETVDNFISAADFCQENNIKLIYPSSGTVYEGETAYAKSKKILEILASNYTNTLGLRIFATYGPNEAHKGEYASIVYQFIKDMKQGKSPVIWGDGTQTRDFIYIDDVIENIIEYIKVEGHLEIGTRINTSFNEVVKIINELLKTDIKPKYIKKPNHYVEKTICERVYYYKVPIKEGIEKIIKSI